MIYQWTTPAGDVVKLSRDMIEGHAKIEKVFPGSRVTHWRGPVGDWHAVKKSDRNAIESKPKPEVQQAEEPEQLGLPKTRSPAAVSAIEAFHQRMK